METKEFTYNQVPFVINYGEGIQPNVIIPDPSGLMRKYFVVDLVINFKGVMIIKVNNQLLDPNGDLIDEAANKPTAKQQTMQDFLYFYRLDIAGQELGESISKQLINGILENTPFKINCYSWTGEFLKPLSFSAEYVDDKIKITIIDHDENLEKEYSFDGGASWQTSSELASPNPGDYDIQVRYKNKELRKGKSFKSVQKTIITITDEEDFI